MKFRLLIFFVLVTYNNFAWSGNGFNDVPYEIGTTMKDLFPGSQVQIAPNLYVEAWENTPSEWDDYPFLFDDAEIIHYYNGPRTWAWHWAIQGWPEYALTDETGAVAWAFYVNYVDSENAPKMEFTVYRRTYLEGSTPPPYAIWRIYTDVWSSYLWNGMYCCSAGDIGANVVMEFKIQENVNYGEIFREYEIGFVSRVGQAIDDAPTSGSTQETYLDCDLSENVLSTFYDVTRPTNWEIWWHGNDGTDELMNSGHYDFAIGPTKFQAARTGCGMLCLYISEDMGDEVWSSMDPVECTEVTTGVPVTTGQTLDPPEGGFATAEKQDEQTALLQQIAQGSGGVAGGATEAKQDSQITELQDIESDIEASNQLLEEIRDSNQRQENDWDSLLFQMTDNGATFSAADAKAMMEADAEGAPDEDASQVLSDMKTQAEGEGDIVTGPGVSDVSVPTSGTAPEWVIGDITISLDHSNYPIIQLIGFWVRNAITWILTFFLAYTFITEVRTAIRTVFSS